MVRTRGGSRLRPRVRFSTPEREAPAPVPTPVPSPVPEAVPKEPQGFQRYQTRMGPRAPSPVPQRRVRRARPSKRAFTSGPGESSSSRPQPSPVTSATEATSSPQLSPTSRIRRPLFVGNPIPGNVRLYRRPFHHESYYDVPALRADPIFRVSEVDRGLFFTALHDSEAVLLPTSGAAVLPLDDISRSRWSA